MRSQKPAATANEERPKRRTRHKQKFYTDRTYGARLPHEDARIMDEFAARNKLDCADVVRLAVKDFTRRQQMSFKRKDPVQAALEETLQDALAPLVTRLDALSNSTDTQGEIAALLRQQQKILERTLLVAETTLRLFIIYQVDAKLRTIDEWDTAQIEQNLSAAGSGKVAWCSLTREVFKRTCNRLLDELGLRPEKASPNPTDGESWNEADDPSTAISDQELEAVFG